MADQHPDTPAVVLNLFLLDYDAEDPSFLPLKKRAMAEKSLPGPKREPQSESESESESGSDTESSDSDDYEDMIEYFGEEFKKNKLEQLKSQAFYSVLYAFTAETSTLSKKRIMIIEKLMNEWNIPHETYLSYKDNIHKSLLAQQQRDDSFASDEKKMEIVEANSLTIFQEKNATSIPTSGSSWGNVNPKSLVGKCVRVRMPDEDHFEEFVIREYDAEHEMHRLEATESDAIMEMDEMFSWMDVREVPPEYIIWEGEEKPTFSNS